MPAQGQGCCKDSWARPKERLHPLLLLKMHLLMPVEASCMSMLVRDFKKAKFSVNLQCLLHYFP